MIFQLNFENRLIFTIKKFFAHIIAPVPLTLLLLTVGVLFLWSTAKHRQLLGKVLSTLALIMLFAFSSPKLSDYYLHSLEYHYPTYQGSDNDINYVVVLGCGHSSSNQKSITSELSHCSMARLLEGVRVSRLHPESKLILSGYGGSDPFSNAEMMKRLIDAVGLSGLQVILEPNPKDTEEEALLLKRYLLERNFVLVTSASHMPRAMSFFQQQGLKPIAAPTHHISSDYEFAEWWDYAPSAAQLKKSERAIYETMGLIWQDVNDDD